MASYFILIICLPCVCINLMETLDKITNAVYGTTNAVYGTTFTDAGVGIGMKRGIRKFDKKGNLLADKAIK